MSIWLFWHLIFDNFEEFCAEFTGKINEVISEFSQTKSSSFVELEIFSPVILVLSQYNVVNSVNELKSKSPWTSILLMSIAVILYFSPSNSK